MYVCMYLHVRMYARMYVCAFVRIVCSYKHGLYVLCQPPHMSPWQPGYRLCQGLLCHQVHPRRLAVAGQVIAGPVCAAHTLHPAVGSLALSVPAVTGVVSHLVEEVLTKTQLLRINSHPKQEMVDSPNKVCYCLVGNQTLTRENEMLKYKSEKDHKKILYKMNIKYCS